MYALYARKKVFSARNLCSKKSKSIQHNISHKLICIHSMRLLYIIITIALICCFCSIPMHAVLIS